MGLRPLQDVNTILLAKLAWHFLKKPNAWWSRILGAKYGNLQARNSDKYFDSQLVVTRGMLTGYKLLEQGLRKDDQGNVESPLWWSKSSKGEFSLKSAYAFTYPAPHQQPQFN